MLMFEPILKDYQHILENLYPEIKKIKLQDFYDKLSKRYRYDDANGYENLGQNFAYIQARMPATFGVIEKVLGYLPADAPIKSLLDLGCGPGTGILSAVKNFRDLNHIHAFEQDKNMAKIASQVLNKQFVNKDIILKNESFLKMNQFPESDLILLSYVLGELKQKEQLDLLNKAWGAAKQYMVIVTPGTPKDFQQFLSWRKFLIDAGAHIVAPCPSKGLCPIESQQNDWCHFSTRISRSQTHKVVKKGNNNFEDEKFCFLILCKEKDSKSGNIIIKKPIKNSGHIILDTCEVENENKNFIKRKILTRSNHNNYKIMANLKWGDYVLSISKDRT